MLRTPPAQTYLSSVLRRVCAALLICASLTLPAAQVVAASPAELRRAEALATEAKAFFRAKLYKDAALQFMEAFALSSRPSLVYNAARAYEEAAVPTKASALFRHYLSLPGVDAGGRAAAQGHLTKLEAILARKRAKAARAKATRAEATRAEATRAEAARNTQRSALAAQERRAAAAGRSVDKRWLAASAGVLVTSAVAYGVALTLATDLAPTDVIDDTSRDRYLNNQSNALVWRGFSVGAGIIGVSLAGWTAWKWYNSAPKGASRSGLWLAPTWTPTSRGVAAGVRF